MRFVDTSFWVALQFTRDQHYEEARILWADRTQSLVTTNHVIGESWTFLRRRLDHRAAVAFVQAARASSRLTIRMVDESAEDDAWS